jgi:hypothetical protein
MWAYMGMIRCSAYLATAVWAYASHWSEVYFPYLLVLTLGNKLPSLADVAPDVQVQPSNCLVLLILAEAVKYPQKASDLWVHVLFLFTLVLIVSADTTVAWGHRSGSFVALGT